MTAGAPVLVGLRANGLEITKTLVDTVCSWNSQLSWAKNIYRTVGSEDSILSLVDFPDFFYCVLSISQNSIHALIFPENQLSVRGEPGLRFRDQGRALSGPDHHDWW